MKKLLYVIDRSCNQKGNYRITRRENDDVKKQLGWQPKDNLKQYIESL